MSGDALHVDWKVAGAKLLMAISVLFIGIVFGMLPIATRTVSVVKRDRLLGICNALAAGIFLAAGIVHLLAESIELFESLYPTNHIVNPTFLLAPFGFFITFSIDKVLFLKEEHPHEEEGNEVDELIKKVGSLQGKEYKEKIHQHHDIKSAGHVGVHEGDHEHVKHELGGHGHSHGLTVSEDGKPSVANYVLVAVLSFHSILAGFVIGLEDEVSATAIIFLALLSHHWIESFALGVAILRNHVHIKYLARLILFFSVMAPSGILIGSVLNFVISGKAGEILEAYAVAICAGSFLYVAIVDILVEEFLIIRDKWYKTISLVVGFSLEAVVVLVFEQIAHRAEEHNDE